MTQRIASPEELNSRMKINRVGVWIILCGLIVAVVVGMCLFLSEEFVIQESNLCYVSELSMPSIDALYEVYLADSVNSDPVSKDDLVEAYGDILKPYPYSQFVYFLIDDMENTEIADGMTFNIGDNTGYVASIPVKATEYENMSQHGIQEIEMRKAGLKPGLSYYIVTAFLLSDDPEPVLASGFYTADVELDTMDPVSFILK